MRLGISAAVTVLATLALASPAEASLYTNAEPISVPGCKGGDCTTAGLGDPYPSTIQVVGLPPISRVRVTLRGITHQNPADIDALLVSPGGQDVLVMSDACGGSPSSSTTLMFEDENPILSSAGPCAPGVYAPTNYGSPDPFFPPAPSEPYGASLSAFFGKDPNGTWSLFALDDAPGAVGTIDGGWRLEILPAVKCAGKSPTEYANVGTGGDDFIVGTPGPDVLIGLGGNDTIEGLGGKDVICGGSGNDKLLGGPGKDVLLGQGGTDKLKGQGGKDICVGGKGADKAKACETRKSI